MVKKRLFIGTVLSLAASLGIGCAVKQPMVQPNDYEARTLRIVNEFKESLEPDTETVMYSQYKNSTSSRIVTAYFVDLDNDGERDDLLMGVWYENEPLDLVRLLIGTDEEVLLVDGGENGYGSVDYARYKLGRGAGSKKFDVRKKGMPIANELYQIIIDRLLEEDTPENSIENLNNLIAQLEDKNK